MRSTNDYQRHLLNLYLINAGVNLIGAFILGALNLMTPTEFFKLRRSSVIADGWVYVFAIYPAIICAGTGLQYLIQRPLHRYFATGRKPGTFESAPARRVRRRLLMLPAAVALLNIAIWTGLSLLAASVLVAAKFIPAINILPLADYPWQTACFATFRGIIIGCLAAALALLVLEAYSRRHLIPVLFPAGGLAAQKTGWHITLRGRIRFLYFSGTLVPMIIFVATLIYLETKAGDMVVPVTVFGRDLLLYTISLYVTFVLLSLWLNFLVGRSILEPIRSMIGAIRRVRQGDYAQRARVVSNDEIGVLGDGINEMTSGLVEGEALRHSYSLAREAQLTLLPGSPPAIPGLDIAARGVFCQETGGDYYDFLQPAGADGSQLGVIMGDACGMGISSALLMVTARALVRQRSAMPGCPADIVTDVNRQLVRDVEKSCRFMALFYLAFDMRQHSLTWVRAGHNPALFWDPSTATADPLRGAGPVLGIDDAWRYRQYHRQGLAAGQTVVLGTDGIWEALNQEGRMFGKDPIIRILNRYPDADANSILTSCLFTLDRFRDGRPLEDDISLVVIRVKD